jgi:hypothetical protein
MSVHANAYRVVARALAGFREPEGSARAAQRTARAA